MRPDSRSADAVPRRSRFARRETLRARSSLPAHQRWFGFVAVRRRPQSRTQL